MHLAMSDPPTCALRKDLETIIVARTDRFVSDVHASGELAGNKERIGRKLTPDANRLDRPAEELVVRIKEEFVDRREADENRAVADIAADAECSQRAWTKWIVVAQHTIRTQTASENQHRSIHAAGRELIDRGRS